MNKITADTLIYDCLNLSDKAADVLREFGMQCFGCALARAETVGQAAMGHGKDVEELVKKLNECLK